MRLPPLPSITDIIRLYKLRAKKQLAQNFLLDMNLTRKIVRKAGKLDGCYVLEVGPGPGGITRPILESAAKQVHVIEKDRRFLPGLQFLSESADGRLTVHHGDVLRFDAAEAMQLDESVARDWLDDPPPIHIIGNLPFNVSTPLIIKWLQAMCARQGLWQYGRTQLTLTFQKEVAERMVAPMLGAHRCRLSLICQFLCDVNHVFTIPGKAFVPEPKVDVGVVKFTPRKEPLVNLPFPYVDKVIRQVFHYRQKTITRGVQSLFPPERHELAVEMMRRANVSHTAVCTSLSNDEVAELSLAYHHLCQREPDLDLINYDYRSKENAAIWRKTNHALFLHEYDKAGKRARTIKGSELWK